MGEMILMTASSGLGFVMADGLDRFLATYSPADATRPTDKFTSDGTGTLANTLNIASMPNWKRLAAGVVVTAVPAGGAMFVKNPYARASLEGMAVGAGISAFKTFWNTVLMPMLVGKDTTVPALQKSYIARLYPSEVAAHINKAAAKAGGNASGMLSDQQQTGVGDVGPFALADSSPYPDAAQALRNATGLHGDSPYDDAAQMLRNRTGVHGDSPYPDAAQALRTGLHAPAGHGNPGSPGLSASDWNPGPPAGVGPGPQATPHKDCGCVGDEYAGFLGGAPDEEPLYNLPSN
ncbi:MAG TPA: hypothetical protein VK607_18215 [Kofleriaceae bacterium]|nr:hypothetical protein [Kofleriaceae bacterium]